MTVTGARNGLPTRKAFVFSAILILHLIMQFTAWG
jgi:hypothetical protein